MLRIGIGKSSGQHVVLKIDRLRHDKQKLNFIEISVNQVVAKVKRFNILPRVTLRVDYINDVRRYQIMRKVTVFDLFF